MFSQLYHNAKRILSRSPSVLEPYETSDNSPHRTAHGIEVTMVTTRRGTETPGQMTPRSSATKRAGKRGAEALDTPTSAKRQKKTTPKKQEVEEVVAEATEDEPAEPSVEELSGTIAVAIPSDTTRDEELLPIRRRESPKVIVARVSPPGSIKTKDARKAQADDVPTSTIESVYETPQQQPGSVYGTPATRKKGGGSPTPKATRSSERKQTSANQLSGRKNKKHIEVQQTTVEVTPSYSNFPDEIPSSTYESEQAPVTSQDTPFTPTPAKKVHQRFGSEEPTSTQNEIAMDLKRLDAPASAQKQPDVFEDDSASDSDEAPDVVSTTAATSLAKSAHHDTQRALEAQQDAERLKREARESRIAAEKADKRKRDEKKAKKLARQLAKQQRFEPVVDDDDTEERTPIDPKNIPDLLPDSILASLPDQRAPTPLPDRRGKTEDELRKEKLSHHIKFLERTDKGPKDVKKGKLSVAVLREQNKVLSPKVSGVTRNVREQWLRGRKVDVKKGGKANVRFGKMERRAHGVRGFLKNGE
jgi:U3 small nucleolar RNA-associated protein 16